MYNTNDVKTLNCVQVLRALQHRMIRKFAMIVIGVAIARYSLENYCLFEARG
jgi:hypothetical protein